MLHKATNLSAVCLFVLGLSSSGCLFGGDDDGGNGGPDPYPQSLQDANVIWALTSGMVDIYNQNLAGKPTGGKDLTASCPLGGSVHITGSTGYSDNNGITTVDLNYDMTDCKFTKTDSGESYTNTVSLTLNGSVHDTGSFSSTYKSENYQATSLNMVGTAKLTPRYEEAEVDQTCDFAASVTGQSGSGSTSGTICGRDASWDW